MKGNNTNTQAKAQLIVERGDGELWGRITIKGNLIVDSAKNLESLKKKIKSLALDFENVDIIEFEVTYDLISFFEQYAYLNVSEIAKKAGISPAMMLHYTSGTKFPSAERVKQIESAIKEIGRELTKVKLHKAQKQLA